MSLLTVRQIQDLPAILRGSFHEILGQIIEINEKENIMNEEQMTFFKPHTKIRTSHDLVDALIDANVTQSFLRRCFTKAGLLGLLEGLGLEYNEFLVSSHIPKPAVTPKPAVVIMKPVVIMRSNENPVVKQPSGKSLTLSHQSFLMKSLGDDYKRVQAILYEQKIITPQQKQGFKPFFIHSASDLVRAALKAGVNQGQMWEALVLANLGGIAEEAFHVAPIKQSESMESDDGKCKICFENSVEVVIAECKHAAMCHRCASLCPTCPICRKAFSQGALIKIFLS